MTDQQWKLQELMLEFHDLCKKNNVRYYLIGSQLWHAERDGVFQSYEIDVAMYLKQWEKIAAQIDQDDAREIESILDGGKLPGCYFRYVDKNTLLLDLNRYGVYAKPGIAINVHIIREQSKKEDKLVFLENGMEDSYLGKWTFARCVVEILRLFKGKQRFAETVMNMMREASVFGYNVKTELREPQKGVCSFDEYFWLFGKKVVWQDIFVNTMRDTTQYLVKRYGEGWKKKKPAIYVTHNMCLFSTKAPYEKFMTEIKNNEQISQDFIKRICKYQSDYKKFQLMKEYERLVWEKALFSTGEKYRLWKKYMPLKQKILSLYEAKEFDELELILEDYITVLEQYLDEETVVCFDQKILEIVKELYRMHEKGEILKRIDQFILAEDLEPIEVTW